MLTQPGTKYAVIGGLILVALGAIAFAVHALTAPSSRPVPTRGGETRYQCGQCGKEYTMTPADFPQQTPDQEVIALDFAAVRRPHCLICGARHAGWMMVQCPQCEKHYLPVGMGPAKADDKRTGDNCPHCGTDRGEWFRKKLPQGRQRRE